MNDDMEVFMENSFREIRKRYRDLKTREEAFRIALENILEAKDLKEAKSIAEIMLRSCKCPPAKSA